MNCVYCQQVKAGMRQVCPLHPDVRREAMVRRSMAGMATVEEQRRERRRRYWERFSVGDAVVLSAGKSMVLLRVPDDEGIQVRFDGVIEELGEVYATVRVDLETVGGCSGMTVLVRPEEMSESEAVHRWTRRTARAINRKRKEVAGELDYWVPL